VADRPASVSRGLRNVRASDATRVDATRTRDDHRIVSWCSRYPDERWRSGRTFSTSTRSRSASLRTPDLVELLARYEPVPPALDDCGARDWSDLHQRMHYISHLSARSTSTRRSPIRRSRPSR
jgi:hypothetical protein